MKIHCTIFLLFLLIVPVRIVFAEKIADKKDEYKKATGLLQDADILRIKGKGIEAYTKFPEAKDRWLELKKIYDTALINRRLTYIDEQINALGSKKLMEKPQEDDSAVRNEEIRQRQEQQRRQWEMQQQQERLRRQENFFRQQEQWRRQQEWQRQQEQQRRQQEWFRQEQYRHQQEWQRQQEMRRRQGY